MYKLDPALLGIVRGITPIGWQQGWPETDDQDQGKDKLADRQSNYCAPRRFNSASSLSLSYHQV